MNICIFLYHALLGFLPFNLIKTDRAFFLSLRSVRVAISPPNEIVCTIFKGIFFLDVHYKVPLLIT